MARICKITIPDHVNVLISGLDSSTKKKLGDRLKWRFPGCYHTPKYKLGIWDGYISLFKSGWTYLNLLSDDVLEIIANAGYEFNIVDNRNTNHCDVEPITKDLFSEYKIKDKIVTLRDYQVEAVNKIVDNPCGIFVMGTGCHAKGTKVVKYDGSFINVEQVQRNDILMGPDSKPRKVLRTITGEGRMYKIIPTRGGKPFVVNGDHILSLKKTAKYKGQKVAGSIISVSVEDYIKWSNKQKHFHKLWRPESISFDESTSQLKIDPYFLGLWLGDGHDCCPTITTMDDEIVEHVNTIAKNNSLLVRKQSYQNNKSSSYHIYSDKRHGTYNNILTQQLRSYDLYRNKHIPLEYKTASIEDRRSLLAGIIDSDGYVYKKCVEITQKRKQLAYDIAFVCRSLGIYVSLTIKTINDVDYYRLSLSGDMSNIPTHLPRKQIEPRIQKKNPLVSGFKVEYIGHSDYYGFELDQDHLYLDDQFIVHHNSGKTLTTAAAASRFKNYGKIIVIVPTIDLVQQTAKTFRDVGLDTGEFYSDEKIVKNYTISTWQSLTNYPEILEGCSCMIADECHEYTAQEVFELLTVSGKHVPHRYGFTGTLPKDDLGLNQLQAALGPVLFEKSTYELQQEGFLSECHITVVQTQEDVKNVGNYQAEQKYLSEHPDRTELISNLIKDISTTGNTLVLVQHTKYGEKLESMIENSVFMAGSGKNKVKSKDRHIQYEKMNSGDNQVVICTYGIASTGIDIPRIYNLVIIEVGKSFTKVIQSIGRSLRKTDDKDFANVYDICATTKFSNRHRIQRKKFYNEAKYPYSMEKIAYEVSD